MNLLEKILNRIGLQRKGLPNMPLAAGFNLHDPFAIFRSDQKLEARKALEQYAGWVYACSRAIGEELAKTRFKLFEIDSVDKTEEIKQHDLLDLLQRVSPFMTGWELMFMLGVHLEACGNAYWYLSGVENEADQPDAIVPLIPSYIKMQKAPLPDFVTGYEYTVDNKTTVYKPYEIIHFRYPNPSDPYEGLGTVQAIMQWIDSDNYASEYNRRFFLNGARIGGFLESQNAVTPEQLEYLKRSFEQVYKGVENAHKVAALPKGTTYKEGSTNQKDMDFVEGQRQSRDKILAGFRVPKTAIGITEDVNRANAEATDYVFAARTIKPKLELICSFLNAYLVPRYQTGNQKLYLSFEDPVPENRQLRIDEMKAATGGNPVISTNEARESYFGLGPVDGGDEVLTAFNLMPLGAPIKETPPAKAQVRVQSQPYDKKKKLKEASGKIAAAAKDIIANVAKEYSERLKAKAKSIQSLSDEQFENLYKAFVIRVTPYEKLMRQGIVKFNKKQKAEVLSNIGKLTKAIKDEDLFDREAGVKTLTKTAKPIFQNLFEKEGFAAAELIGFSGFTSANERSRQMIERAVSLMAESYNDTTLVLLKEKLQEAIDSGASMEEIQNSVSQIYEFSDQVRASQVATTETFRVANSSTKEAWTQSGVVKTIKWYTSNDEVVCEYCAPMNGEIISIEDSYFDKGDTASGNDGGKLDLTYDNVEAPPLHVSCRCYIRPEDIEV